MATLEIIGFKLVNDTQSDTDNGPRWTNKLAKELRAQLERSPCGPIVEALKNLLEACYQADAFEVLPPQITGELMDAARKALMDAPAFQPTTEPLLNISEANNDWNKRAIAANRAEHAKEGEK